MSQLSHAPASIGQIALHVSDLERATVFYRDVLGLRFLFQAPPGLAFFECGGVRLMLSSASEPGHDHPGSILYYRVDDLPAAYEAMRAKGAEFVDEPHVVHRTDTYELWMTFLEDPAGNTLALMEERAVS